MKRSVLGLGVAVALALGGSHFARAEEPAAHAAAGEHAEGHEAHNPTLAEAVFAHIADDSSIEFGNPFTGEEVRFQLPRIPHAFGISWLDLSITKHLVWMWICAILTIGLFLLWRPRSITPKGFPVFLEMLVIFIRDEVARPTIGEGEYKRYTPYLLSSFFFILVMNLAGIIPYVSTPTGNIAVTGALAICTFFVTQYASFRSAGFVGFFKHLSGGAPWWLVWLMAPIEIFGLFTKPFALCVRLFANMLAGHFVIFFILGLIFIFKSALVSPVSVGLAACIFLLEIFVALLQAYIFTMLSSVFIGMGVAMGHHDHEDHHAEHDPKLVP